MKTTKKLLKTLLMSLMLVSCLGANAMAEEGVTDSGNMNVNLDLQSTFTWQIPQGITIDQSTLKGKNIYEENFDVSITSVTLNRNEEVQVVIERETGDRYYSNEKKFYMSDTSDVYNTKEIDFFIRNESGEENISINEVLLTADAESNPSASSPATKKLRLVMPCVESLNRTGTYAATLKFQARVVTKNA